MWTALGSTGTPLEEKNVAAPEELKPPSAEQVRRTGYEYGIPLASMTSSVQVAASSERQQILNQLHQLYMSCDWVSSAIDVIARTVTAGGLQVVSDADVTEGDIMDDPPPVVRLKRLARYTNPREDMIQLLRGVLIDLLLFGDAYLEVVTLLDEPVALYSLDATTMTVIADQHGEVLGYSQDVDGVRSADFTPDQVIHFSLDAPRGGLYGVSPAQKALLPATAWLFTMATLKECFRRGDPPRVHVDLGHYNDTDIQKWREQYTVYNLGPKSVGAPLITTGGGVVQVLDPRKVVDYLDTARQLRDEIVSAFGVPPSKLGIIETGNLGGGTAEGQDKSFRVNTVIPIGNLILEKLNFHLLQQGFGIYNYHLTFAEIDFRDSKIVEEIRDIRLRNGSYCVDEETEILTSAGWKHYDTLQAGDAVLTLNHQTGESEWQPCQEVCVFPADRREMVRTRVRGHSSLTTPNHRWPVVRYNLAAREWRRVWTTSERQTVWDRVLRAAPRADCPVEAVHEDAFVELVAWFWTEGHAPARNRFVTICQKKPEGVERIRAALEKLFGPPYEQSKYHRTSDPGCWIERLQGNDGKRSFRIAASHGQLFRDVVADHVVSTEFLMSLTQRQLDLFIEVSLMADGDNSVSGQAKLGQKRREAAEQFQLACILSGRSATITERVFARDGYRMWMVNVDKVGSVMPKKAVKTGSGAVMETVTHNGIVWCPRTPNQSWMARRDGTVYFTGNTLNRYRDEIGEPPVPGGDVAIIVDRTGSLAWDDVEAMSKANVAYRVAPLTQAGVNGYVPGVPDPEEEPATDLGPDHTPVRRGDPGLPPPAKTDDRKPGAKQDPTAVPGGSKDATQGKAPKEDAAQRDNRRLTEAWQKAYRARRAQALRELPKEDVA
jgi:HK97 family phage portal protein